MAYAHDSKSCDGNIMRVQLPLPALNKNREGQKYEKKIKEEN